MDITSQTKRTSQGSKRGARLIMALTAAGVVVAGLFASGNATVYNSTQGRHVYQGVSVGNCYDFDAGYDLRTGFFVDQC